jgi:hypothetical protein
MCIEEVWLVGMECFMFVSVVVFSAVILRLLGSTPKSNEISTLLVAAIAVSYQFIDESCRFRDLRELCGNAVSERMEMTTLGNIMWRRQHQQHRKRQDNDSSLMSVMASSPQVVPLLLSSSDYSLVGVMLREQNWRIVCACEKSHSVFVAEVRSKAAFYAADDGTDAADGSTGRSKKGKETSSQGDDFFRVYSKLLAMLERRYSESPESHPHTGWYPHY